MLFVLVVKFLGFFIDFINLVDIGFVIVVNKIGVFVDIVVNDWVVGVVIFNINLLFLMSFLEIDWIFDWFFWVFLYLILIFLLFL